MLAHLLHPYTSLPPSRENRNGARFVKRANPKQVSELKSTLVYEGRM